MYKLTIPDCSYAMYVNPHDQKGNSLIRCKGMSQPRIVRFWRAAVKGLQPDLIIDAGVNYGEILLSAEYEPNAEIIGIEANSTLSPYLSRSLAEHPNGGQINIEYAFASDRNEEAASFYIDTLRSGNSSAYLLKNRPMRQTFVKSVTIDSLVSSRKLARDAVLFKLDIEGHEWNALKGMARILGESREAAGCIEFNIAYMQDKGIDVEAFMEYLQQYFTIYATSGSDTLVTIRPSYYRNILEYYARDKACNDIILLSSPALLEKLKLHAT